MELGATSSIFPADGQVHKFLKAQGREDAYRELLPDEDAEYDGTISINLSELEPLAACPHQPDQVRLLKNVEKRPVQQVFIGSCTNASYSDVAKAALVFKGRKVNENVSCTCTVASKGTYRELLKDGYIDMLLEAGVRMLEISCGPCCGVGQAPATEGIAVRTSNRNFKGRSGNPNAQIYLVSPESAAATAIRGTFASAEDIMGKDIGLLLSVHEPEKYMVDDSMILPQDLCAPVSLKGGDNISTDDITPASAEFSSMRSNIPLLSGYCYHRYAPDFAARAEKMGSSIIVAGENYGQGSSREHAAITPMYLGVKCVIAKSIARIHKGNLVNHGIVPMLFEEIYDYEKIDQGDELVIHNLPARIPAKRAEVINMTKGFSFMVRLDLSESEMQIVLGGGRLRFLKKQIKTSTPYQSGAAYMEA